MTVFSIKIMWILVFVIKDILIVIELALLIEFSIPTVTSKVRFPINFISIMSFMTSDKTANSETCWFNCFSKFISFLGELVLFFILITSGTSINFLIKVTFRVRATVYLPSNFGPFIRNSRLNVVFMIFFYKINR